MPTRFRTCRAGRFVIYGGGSARVRRGVTRARRGITRTRRGITRTRRGIARARRGVTRARRGVSVVELYVRARNRQGKRTGFIVFRSDGSGPLRKRHGRHGRRGRRGRHGRWVEEMISSREVRDLINDSSKGRPSTFDLRPSDLSSTLRPSDPSSTFDPSTLRPLFDSSTLRLFDSSTLRPSIFSTLSDPASSQQSDHLT